MLNLVLSPLRFYTLTRTECVHYAKHSHWSIRCLFSDKSREGKEGVRVGRERYMHITSTHSDARQRKKEKKGKGKMKMVAHVLIQLSNTDAVSHGTPIKSKRE